MIRYISDFIKKDLESKIILLSGPRQVGKTTLARSLFTENSIEYLNFDNSEDRKKILEHSWVREGKELVVFDELHKMRKWKQWVKGIYDKEGVRPRIIVTGSAKLDVFRKSGDSLAGRHFSHRLHPFSLAEVADEIKPDDALQRLEETGGFPEPFLKGSESYANRWRKTHLDIIIREDLLDLEKVRELKSIEILVDLLSYQVGQPVSYSSLSRDLQVSPHSVKHWIEILERLYVVFRVSPYSKNIARALRKEPKIYFFDTARIKNGEAAKIENIVACALLKRAHFLEDTEGTSNEVFYLRDHQQREIDFLTVKNNKAEYLIEVKTSDGSPSKPLSHYLPQIGAKECLQLVKNLRQKKDIPVGKKFIHLRKLSNWLTNLEA